MNTIKHLRLSVPCLLFSLLMRHGSGEVIRIGSKEDYENLFSRDPASFSKYLDATILLESDIVFGSEVYPPLGSDSFPFNGVFDGQGHIMKDLKINTTGKYVGLIGYSEGAIIRNVIVKNDIVIPGSSETQGDIYAGGLLGYYESVYECKIENCINLGAITHNNGNKNTNLYIGGILGYSSNKSSLSSSIKNCANYGLISFNDGNIIGAGGIIGYSNPSNALIANCLNAGEISASSNIFNQLYVGGIAGFSRSGDIKDCVNNGDIPVIPSEKTSIGGVCGYTEYAFLLNCFNKENIQYLIVGNANNNVDESYNFSESLELESEITSGNYTGKSLISYLNEKANSEQDKFYSHWVSNTNGVEVTFKYHENEYTISSKVILMPEFRDENPKWFNGWYKDMYRTDPFNSSEITEKTTLYGKTKDGTVNFYARDEFVGSVSGSWMGQITPIENYFELKRDDCEFKYWADKDGNVYNKGDLYTILSENVTLHAVLQCGKIITADDFVDFSILCNNDGRSNVDVSLENDIDFDGCDRAFIPIGTNTPFMGSFDGKGYAIKKS